METHETKIQKFTNPCHLKKLACVGSVNMTRKAL